MRLVGQLYVTVPSARVKRDPTFMEKVKRGFGGTVDLDTDEVQNQLEATSVVDAVRRSLGRLGVGNALSLVIDETVVFQDSDGKADDLPDLVLALADHASLFGRGFRELKFAAEHEEAGLHLVIETRARTRHRREDPAAVVSVGGRIKRLEPEKGESAEAYRARVEPLTRDAALFEASRLAFESFVARLRDALSAAMPEARVDEHKAEARVVKAPENGARPTDDPSALERAPREPTHPAYDPFVVYYPSPMTSVLDAMLFTSFMHMMMPPPVLLVSPWGAPLGVMSDVQAHPELADISDFDRAGIGDFGDDRDDDRLRGIGDDDGDHDDRASLASDDDAATANDQGDGGFGDEDGGGGLDDDGGDDGGGWSDGGWDGGGWDDGGGGDD